MLEETTTRHLVINTDPGVDDAIALLAAAASAPERFDKVDLVAIYGNDSTKQTGRNLLTLSSFIDEYFSPSGQASELHYYSGADRASNKHRRYTGNADFVMGENGMAGLSRNSSRTLSRSEQMYRQLASEPNAKVDVVSLGAVTELAKMVTRPELKGKISSITVMGGTLFEEGNFNMHTEWNLSNDPKALESILRTCDEQHIPFTLVPLDLTQRPEIALTAERYEWLHSQLEAKGSHAMAELIERLVGPESTYYKFFMSEDNTRGNRHAPYDRIQFRGAVIHDLTAQLVQLDPENFEIYPMEIMLDEHGAVGTAGQYMANKDFGLHTINVAMGVKDPERYWQQTLNYLSQYK